MLAGQSWQTAVAESQLHIGRASAYRLVQYARDEDKAPQIFLDDRHGHPYKVTEPVQAWIREVCTDHVQMPSSSVQSELKSRFGVVVSVRETQSGESQVRSEQPVERSGWGTE
jgi:transposase